MLAGFGLFGLFGLRGCRRLGGLFVERLLQELLGGLGPHVAVGLRVEQRLFERSRLRARDVVDAARGSGRAASCRMGVGLQRRIQRLPRRASAPAAKCASARPRLARRRRLPAWSPVPAARRRRPASPASSTPSRRSAAPRFRPNRRRRRGRARFRHRVGVALLVVSQAPERMCRPDERLHLHLAEGVFAPFARSFFSLASPAAITADSSSFAPSALPADRRAMPMPTCASCRLASTASAARNSFSAAPGRRCSNSRQPFVSSSLASGASGGAIVAARRRRGGTSCISSPSRTGRDRCGPPRPAVRAPWPRRRRSCRLLRRLWRVIVLVLVVVIARVVPIWAAAFLAPWGSLLRLPWDDVPCWGRDLTVKKPSRSRHRCSPAEPSRCPRPGSSIVWPPAEEEGAKTLRCPLIAIQDAPDQRPVEAWLRTLAAGEMDDLVFLTGEGLRRLLAAADRIDLRADVVAALTPRAQDDPRAEAGARAEGDRPRARSAGGGADVAGVIDDAGARLDLHGRRVGVQLYGEEPNRPLVSFSARGARCCVVAPYVYASASDDAAVAALIAALAEAASTRSRSPARRRSIACGRWPSLPGSEARLRDGLGARPRRRHRSDRRRGAGRARRAHRRHAREVVRDAPPGRRARRGAGPTA